MSDEPIARVIERSLQINHHLELWEMFNALRFVSRRRRWVVERSFGWLNRFRRLASDYE